MVRVGLVLSGAGFKDGTEIQEAVVAMLALEEAGAAVICAAPDKALATTAHLEGGSPLPPRRVLEESARISRGKIRPLAALGEADVDAVVMPGGYGAALNLCDFASRGAAMTVDPDLARLLVGAQAAGKPLGAICIAPVILAKLFGHQGARVTVGHDLETAAAIAAMGAVHVPSDVDGIVVDDRLRLVTTPAYMLAESVKDIHRGIRRLAEEVVRLAALGRSPAPAGVAATTTRSAAP